MGKSIYLARAIPELVPDMLRAKGYEVDVFPEDRMPSRKELLQALKRRPYDALIAMFGVPVDAEVFDAAPSIKVVANYAIGYDNIDLIEAKKRGIAVSNTPGDFAYTIAEHAMALMLGLTTRLIEADSYVRAGKYESWSPTRFMGSDIQGSTLGLIGAGRIGERVAHHASRGFDMRVFYYDVKRNEKIESEYGAVYVPTVEKLLPQADIVSLHVPLLDTTRHLIDESRLRLMKPTAFLINTSRGPIIDENALVTALRDGVIRGAGLDVFEREPELSQGLSELPNVILTPHIASARERARLEMAHLVADNVISFFETGSVVNPVQ